MPVLGGQRPGQWKIQPILPHSRETIALAGQVWTGLSSGQRLRSVRSNGDDTITIRNRQLDRMNRTTAQREPDKMARKQRKGLHVTR